MLESILASTTGSITLTEILICTGASLIFGIVIALVHSFRSNFSSGFLLTIALLPVIVQSVIMVVNGNLGTGVAVAGAFSLIRFRSAPGSAKEIASIFFATAVGLSAGMGYIAYAGLFTLIIGGVIMIYKLLRFGEQSATLKRLRITIPEDLDYNGVFDDIFLAYTKNASLEKVRTTNLGSLFELQYAITLKSQAVEKEMIDKIRQRNGNLNITCGRISAITDEL